MPIYEYKCEKCGYDFDIMQKFSEKPLKKCPKCSGKLKKLIAQTSFILKGSGWYVTDYARKEQGAKKGFKAKDTKPKDAKKEESSQSTDKSNKSKKS